MTSTELLRLLLLHKETEEQFRLKLHWNHRIFSNLLQETPHKRRLLLRERNMSQKIDGKEGNSKNQ